MIKWFLIVQFFLCAEKLTAVQLVSDESIALQKKLTSKFQLENGIPVTVRHEMSSDIIHISVAFDWGRKDFPKGKQILEQALWGAMVLGAKGYTKEKIYEIVEKYGIALSCSGGVEMSWCTLETINEYWDTALDLLAAVIKYPTFDPKEVALQRARLEADLKSTFSNPEQYVNDIINRVFYEKNHPFRANYDESLDDLKTLTVADMNAYHKKIVTADRMHFIVVSSLSDAILKRDLSKRFKSIKRRNKSDTTEHDKVSIPQFNKDRAYSFEHRDIPTAYMRIKFNTPSVFDNNRIATLLLFEVFEKELDEEIRTKNSLSYSIYAQTLQYSVGVGFIGVSTSKPKETLQSIQKIIKQLKERDYTPDELEEYKHLFATGYYTNQETHGSLAGGMLGYIHYFNDVERFYDFPKELEKVKPEDVKKCARDILKNFRVGILYSKDKFKDEWATSFINETSESH